MLALTRTQRIMDNWMGPHYALLVDCVAKKTRVREVDGGWLLGNMRQGRSNFYNVGDVVTKAENAIVWHTPPNDPEHVVGVFNSREEAERTASLHVFW